MKITGIIVSLIMLAVVFGAGTQFLKAPGQTNALLAASSDTVVGIQHALEGK